MDGSVTIKISLRAKEFMQPVLIALPNLRLTSDVYTSGSYHG